MVIRCRKICQIVRVLPRFFSGVQYRAYTQAAVLPSLRQIPIPFAYNRIHETLAITRSCVGRFSSIAKLPQEDPHESNLMSFIKFAFDEPKGFHHCWLNRGVDGKDGFRKDSVYLVVTDTSVDNSSVLGQGALLMLEKAKLLQQRYPWVNVFALQSSSCVHSNTCVNLFFDVLLKEYITFPILLSTKTFSEVSNGACYLLFKGISSAPLYLKRDTDLGVLHNALKVLNGNGDENLGNIDKLTSTWSKKLEFVKQPFGSYSLRGLLLQFPACISKDVYRERFFLSDCNHHRIIVFHGDGKIMDVIGSSPGFEDGEFETAKLMRPAASYYDASVDCLYILDSENHAVRRAHMGSRVVETLYFSTKDKERDGLWTWIMDKLGMKKDVGVRSDEFDSNMLILPWYLLESDGDLFVMNRSLDTLWTLDLDKGLLKDVVKGSAEIVVKCGEKIAKEVSPLQRLPRALLEHIANSTRSLDGIPYSGLLCSFVTSGNRLHVCDAVSQRVVTFSEQDEDISNLQFSEFGTLGLPYWLPSSLEKVHQTNLHGEEHVHHLHSLELLPGRIGIGVNVLIPSSTVLIEPMQEGCIWRQVRGAAMENSGAESTGESSEKVGIAQQFYDDLDNLAFEREAEISTSNEKSTSERDFKDDRVRINCIINTSPGTSEVIIYAALYLKLKSSSNASKGDQEKKAAIIADVLKPERRGEVERDAFVHFLSKSKVDLEDLVLVKPLHVRIRLNTLDHPKADNSKDYILTDCNVEFNASL